MVGFELLRARPFGVICALGASSSVSSLSSLEASIECCRLPGAVAGTGGAVGGDGDAASGLSGPEDAMECGADIAGDARRWCERDERVDDGKMSGAGSKRRGNWQPSTLVRISDLPTRRNVVGRPLFLLMALLRFSFRLPSHLAVLGSAFVCRLLSQVLYHLRCLASTVHNLDFGL